MSDHGARALVLAALALVGGGLLLWWRAGADSGLEDLAAAVAAARPGDRIVVAEVVDRPWDELHVFAPYTPPQDVEAAVGERVGAVRGLVADGVLLLVLTDRDGAVASELVARRPVDWLPLADGSPYGRDEAVLAIVAGQDGPELRIR
jgi:hypothetical protein